MKIFIYFMSILCLIALAEIFFAHEQFAKNKGNEALQLIPL
ncbi:hypothetical protein [Bdellovibrio svalbardensis]|uniref:Uncharacterized protein n=1 Tax=Bdellovibrio svalbardensis TaxID=2972972 RepID=A0ABT6DEL6_9BACT|nr:hypothetical protein [Bdellovibrio svalbardensis]MDG0815262.1 hypothetical protein [Bdellovibrio svalbardensis]